MPGSFDSSTVRYRNRRMARGQTPTPQWRYQGPRLPHEMEVGLVFVSLYVVEMGIMESPVWVGTEMLGSLVGIGEYMLVALL